MRTLLYAAAVLVFLAGVQLFVFPERTATYFAWTVQPPLTAVFLGASYWSSVAFEATAARQRRWSDARIAVPTVFVFTVLTLVVTLVHIDKFHLGSQFELATRAVTWVWIAIYSIVPLLMVALMFVQHSQPGDDAPRATGRPSLWLAGLIAVHAVVLLALGAWLLLTPLSAARVWPWTLTPLTGRAIGAWLFSLGIAAAHALWERDHRRLRPAAAAYISFAVLQAIALARYASVPTWDVRGYVYVAFLVSALVAGLAALRTDPE
jgi:hypothetical protein